MPTVDDFEDGDIAEYSGATSGFAATNAPSTVTPVSGSYVLEFTGTGWNQIYSTTGLATYPAQGDRYIAYVAGDNLAEDKNVYLDFGFQDANNHYYLRLDLDGGSGDINRYEAGTVTELVAGTFSTSYSAGSWLRVELAWDDGNTFGGAAGDMTVDVYNDAETNILTLFANDTTWASGGIGWEADAGATTSHAWFDDAHIDSGADPGALTAAAATPLTGAETTKTAAVDAGAVTATAAAPLASAESTKTAVVDPGGVTAATAASITSAETTGDQGGITVAAATPLATTEAASATDPGVSTAAAATPLAATEVYGVIDTGAVTAAAAAPLVGTEAALAVDAGGMTAAVAAPLVGERVPSSRRVARVGSNQRTGRATATQRTAAVTYQNTNNTSTTASNTNTTE